MISNAYAQQEKVDFATYECTVTYNSYNFKKRQIREIVINDKSYKYLFYGRKDQYSGFTGDCFYGTYSAPFRLEGIFSISNTSEGVFSTDPTKTDKSLSITLKQLSSIELGQEEELTLLHKSGKTFVSGKLPVAWNSNSVILPSFESDCRQYLCLNENELCIDKPLTEIDFPSMFTINEFNVWFSYRRINYATFTGKGKLVFANQPLSSTLAVSPREGTLDYIDFDDGDIIQYYSGYDDYLRIRMKSCTIEKTDSGYQVTICYRKSPLDIAKRILKFTQEQFESIDWWDIQAYQNKCTDISYETEQGEIISMQK